MLAYCTMLAPTGVHRSVCDESLLHILASCDKILKDVL